MNVQVQPIGEFKILNVLVVGEDGQNHRYTKHPLDNFEDQPQEVLAARAAHHTPEIVDAYRDFLDEQSSKFVASGKRRIGSPREFLELFSEAEQVAFFAAESADVGLKIWWAKASTGDFSLDHPSVADGLAGLVAAGILSQERSNEILSSDFDQA